MGSSVNNNLTADVRIELEFPCQAENCTKNIPAVIDGTRSTSCSCPSCGKQYTNTHIENVLNNQFLNREDSVTMYYPEAREYYTQWTNGTLTRRELYQDKLKKLHNEEYIVSQKLKQYRSGILSQSDLLSYLETVEKHTDFVSQLQSKRDTKTISKKEYARRIINKYRNEKPRARLHSTKTKGIAGVRVKLGKTTVIIWGSGTASVTGANGDQSRAKQFLTDVVGYVGGNVISDFELVNSTNSYTLEYDVELSELSRAIIQSNIFTLGTNHPEDWNAVEAYLDYNGETVNFHIGNSGHVKINATTDTDEIFSRIQSFIDSQSTHVHNDMYFFEPKSDRDHTELKKEIAEKLQPEFAE